MRKIIKYIALALCLLTVSGTFSCTKNKMDIYSLAKRLNEVFPEESGRAYLCSDRENDGYYVIDAKEFGRIYSGKIEAPTCFSRVAGYAVRLPADQMGLEIHIIECVNRSDTDEIYGLVQARVDRIRSSEIMDYIPESYEKYYAGAEVYVYKNAVFLLATPDNKAVKKQIKKLY